MAERYSFNLSASDERQNDADRRPPGIRQTPARFALSHFAEARALAGSASTTELCMLAILQCPSDFLHIAIPRPCNRSRADWIVNSYSYHTASPMGRNALACISSTAGGV
jgi:hypothetical protein